MSGCAKCTACLCQKFFVVVGSSADVEPKVAEQLIAGPFDSYVEVEAVCEGYAGDDCATVVDGKGRHVWSDGEIGDEISRAVELIRAHLARAA